MAAVGGVMQQGGQAITLCISSIGGSPEQAFYAYEVTEGSANPAHDAQCWRGTFCRHVRFLGGVKAFSCAERKLSNAQDYALAPARVLIRNRPPRLFP